MTKKDKKQYINTMVSRILSENQEFAEELKNRVRELNRLINPEDYVKNNNKNN